MFHLNRLNSPPKPSTRPPSSFVCSGSKPILMGFPLPARRTSFPPKRKDIPTSNIHHTSIFLSESQNSRNTKRHFAFSKRTFVHLHGFVLLDEYLLQTLLFKAGFGNFNVLCLFFYAKPFTPQSFCYYSCCSTTHKWIKYQITFIR